MLHLLEMGERFCETAERLAQSETQAREEDVFQNLHWGLELVLKAYLHSRGWNDERCIAEVRHDIAKALTACERCGLRGVTADARAFVSALSPYSQVHRVDAFVKAGSGHWTVVAATEAGASLRRAVRKQIA